MNTSIVLPYFRFLFEKQTIPIINIHKKGASPFQLSKKLISTDLIEQFIAENDEIVFELL